MATEWVEMSRKPRSVIGLRCGMAAAWVMPWNVGWRAQISFRKFPAFRAYVQVERAADRVFGRWVSLRPGQALLRPTGSGSCPTARRQARPCGEPRG